MNNSAIAVSSANAINGAGAASDARSPNPHPLLIDAVFDGFYFIFRFPFVKEITEVIKQPPFSGTYVGNGSSPYFRYWKFNKSVIHDFGELFIEEINEVVPAKLFCSYDNFMDIVDYISARPVPVAFIENLHFLVYSLDSEATATIGSYHPGVVNVFRRLRGRYLPTMKAWVVDNSIASDIKEYLISELHFQDEQIELVDGVCKITDGYFASSNSSAKTIEILNNKHIEENARAVVVEEEIDNSMFLAVTTPLARSHFSEKDMTAQIAAFDLYDFQREGVKHLISNSSALLADDMGLGKTRQAVAAACIVAGSDKILVTCPASLIINWTREIRFLFPEATIAQQAFDPECQWVVTNYERLNTMIKHASSFKVLVTDEAHLLKEASSQRTRLAFDIASKIPYRFLLTGTPILNREREIHTLLRLSGHPVGNIPIKDFEAQFAGDPTFRANLNTRISEWMLRRKKDIVLKSLKGKQHHVSFISYSDEQRSRYDACANDNSLIALAKIVKLRVILEFIKLQYVIDFIKSLSPADKCLVFCEFKESVADLKSYFANSLVGIVSLVGSDSITKRQAAVDAFQSDSEIQVFVGTTAAAGVGHNLTAANHVIFCSLPWTPALKDQAEDRAYRNGQQRAVFVKIPLLENSIDDDLWEMLQNKKSISDDIIDPDAAAAAAMGDLAAKLSDAQDENLLPQKIVLG